MWRSLRLASFTSFLGVWAGPRRRCTADGITPISPPLNTTRISTSCCGLYARNIKETCGSDSIGGTRTLPGSGPIGANPRSCRGPQGSRTTGPATRIALWCLMVLWMIWIVATNGLLSASLVSICTHVSLLYLLQNCSCAAIEKEFGQKIIVLNIRFGFAWSKRRFWDLSCTSSLIKLAFVYSFAVKYCVCWCKSFQKSSLLNL